MSKVSVILSSGKTKIKLIGENKLLKALGNSRDLFYWIPNLRIANYKKSKNLTCLEIDSKNNHLNLHKNKPLYAKYGDRRLVTKIFTGRSFVLKDLIWLILPIMERQRQENNQYLVHAAAFNYQKNGVILFGETFSGKTLLLSELIYNHPCKAIGTEHTLVGEAGIEGGTHIMQLSKKIKSFLPNLPVTNQTKTNSQYSNNITSVNLKKEKKYYYKKSPINLMLYISINPHSRKVISVDWNFRKSLLFLAEKMRWMILGSKSFLYGTKEQLMSLDTPDISRKRLKLIKSWLENGKRVNYIEGPPSLVAQTIISRLRV